MAYIAYIAYCPLFFYKKKNSILGNVFNKLDISQPHNQVFKFSPRCYLI